jgi:hypothetical protein
MVRLPKWLLLLLSLVVIVGLVGPVVAADAKGKIKSITADRNECVVTDESGKDWTFTLTDDCKIRLNDENKKLSDLREGDEVTVTFDTKNDRNMVTMITCNRK